MNYIGEKELIKLLDILREKGISIDIITTLCKVNHLLDINMKQYNYLLYILCLK